MAPGLYNKRRVYEHPIPVIDNEIDRRSDLDENEIVQRSVSDKDEIAQHSDSDKDDEYIESANRSESPQVHSQHECHEDDMNQWSENEDDPLPYLDGIDEDFEGTNSFATDSQLERFDYNNDAIGHESPHVKAEVVISSNVIFEITEMLNGEIENELIVPANGWEETEKSVENDALTTDDEEDSNIMVNESGLWTVDDVPTTLPVASALDFDANVQDVVDDVTGTSNASAATAAIDFNAQDVDAYANPLPIGKNEDDVADILNDTAAATAIGLIADQGSVASSIMPTADSDANCSIGYYDSEDDVVVMSFSGTKFPAPIQSDPLTSTFVKRENDIISGDMPYEEVNVSLSGFRFK